MEFVYMEKNNIKCFTVDEQSIDKLKEQFHSNGLDECIYTLDSLVSYAKMRYGVFGEILTNSNLSADDKKDCERKVATAERKFRYMIDVPELCLKRAVNHKYSNERATLLTTVGILHDIGRIDEIISQNKDSVFKLKVDHAQLGVDYLFSGENQKKYYRK